MGKEDEILFVERKRDTTEIPNDKAKCKHRREGLFGEKGKKVTQAEKNLEPKKRKFHM